MTFFDLIHQSTDTRAFIEQHEKEISQRDIYHRRKILFSARKVDDLKALEKIGINLLERNNENFENIISNLVYHNEVESVEYILSHYPAAIETLNDPIENDQTPIFFVKSSEMFDVLMKYGKDVIDLDFVDINYECPLHYISRQGEIKLIEKFLDAGANPIPQNAEGKTPLHIAFETPAQKALLALYQAKFPDKIVSYLDTPDALGNTALFYQTRIEQAEMLLKLGVNINHLNKFNEAASGEYARCKGYHFRELREWFAAKRAESLGYLYVKSEDVM